jgi:hypothetical protein
MSDLVGSNKTGIFHVTTDLDEHAYTDPGHLDVVQAGMKASMMARVFQRIMDGRSYVVTFDYKENLYPKTDPQLRFIKLQYTVIILIHDPKQAEVDEYVVLGSVETLVPDMMTFIHLGNDLMFSRDDVGWRRVSLSADEKEDIHHEVARLRDADEGGDTRSRF